MLLYKYRSLNRLERVLDILHRERLYCSPYSELNDPFEGQFFSVFPTNHERQTPAVMRIPGASDLLKGMENRGIVMGVKDALVCSLSATCNDMRMWSIYADGHRGVAVEIDINTDDEPVYEVKYRDRLPKYQSNLFSLRPDAKYILTRKTQHWKYEAEYRVIQDETYYPISGQIQRIILGARIPSDREELLRRVVLDVEFSKAELIPGKIEVQVPSG